jgi:hypothetical protein
VASGALELFAAPDTSAKSALQALISVNCRYGPTAVLRTEQGSQYNNAVIAAYCKYVETGQTFTLSPYTPMQVGKVERKNADVMSHVRAIVMARNVRDSWSRVLPLVQRVVMHTYHRPIGMSPYRYVYGTKAAANHGLLLPSTVPLSSTVEDLVVQLDTDLRAVVEASLTYRAVYIAERVKAQPSASTVYPNDSYVLVKFPHRAPKLLRWRGPYLVLSHNGNAYDLQDLTTMELVTYDISMLKSFDASDVPPAQLVAIARLDHGEEVIDHIVSYTGNPARLNSLEFRVRWHGAEAADDTYHWHRDFKTTAALDAFILLHPELQRLNRK